MIVWISKTLALAIHDRQLAEHGGIDAAGFGQMGDIGELARGDHQRSPVSADARDAAGERPMIRASQGGG